MSQQRLGLRTIRRFMSCDFWQQKLFTLTVFNLMTLVLTSHVITTNPLRWLSRRFFMLKVEVLLDAGITSGRISYLALQTCFRPHKASTMRVLAPDTQGQK